MIQKKNLFIILFVAFLLSFLKTEIIAQNSEPISDFYQFANKEWIENTVLTENYIVINQSGILWEKIENKSIEILTDNLTYGLDEEYLYALQQLRSFYKSTSGTIENSKKRVAEVLKNFPMTYGILFSKITISKQKEEMIKEIIKYLTIAYKYKLENTNNIGNKYKDLFLNKLDNLKIEIGAPSLSEFPKIPTLSDNSYSNNLKLAQSYKIEIGKVQTNWKEPYETDCFYYANSNTINLYAGMLFDFDDGDDIEYLFATLGRTIAHEMTHAFDMVGQNYDMNGERISFLKKTFSGLIFCEDNRKEIHRSLIHQFSKYSYHDSLFVNGEKTLQENYADLGGVEVSILALKIYLKDKYKNTSDSEINDSLKKYFLYYARFWKEKGTKEYKILSFKRVHTPQKFRAIGPIYNQNEFYQLYNIDNESEYYIPESIRVSIW